MGAALALAALLQGCGGGAGPMEVARLNHSVVHKYPIHGIDVSKFQGDIDWNRVANSGVKFAWIKATEGGDHVDQRFQANWAAAKAAGVPRGAYHFVYWCRPPREEIDWFKENVPVEADALPPVLDVEATPTSKTCKRHLTQAGAIRDMQIMLDEMERHYGKRPVIYTTVDFYQAILSDGAFSDYPIWVRSTKYHPSVKYAGRDWRFWQYQSDGWVPGIDVKVDRDAFYGTHEQWAAFLGGSRGRPVQEAPAEPQTAPVPQIEEAAAPAPAVEASAYAAAPVEPAAPEQPALVAPPPVVPSLPPAAVAAVPEPPVRPASMANAEALAPPPLPPEPPAPIEAARSDDQSDDQ